jgi:hypothetical protein
MLSFMLRVMPTCRSTGSFFQRVASNGLARRGAGVRYVCLVLTALLFFVHGMPAQVIGTATIQGTVQDPSGAVIPDAMVTATNVGTGLVSSQMTTSAGSYSITALPPGEYTVRVTMTGFDPYVQEHMLLDALRQLGLNITLRPGATETVIVSNAPPDLQTENGSLEYTIPQTTYNALPIVMNGGPKSPIGFVTLVPGVSLDPTFSTPTVGGGIQVSSAMYINGLPLASSELQTGTENLESTSTEVIDQFQVITSGTPAFYDGQGVVNLVLKSGTNKFHGSIYENLRNTIFDAAGYFSSGTVPTEHQNEYGFTVGGPVLKNRIFFFGSFDKYKIRYQTTPQFSTVPTLAERTGDFSAFPEVIYDPSTTKLVNGVLTRQPFPGNQVPVRSSVAQSFQSYLPDPQNSSIAQNYFSLFPNGEDNHIYTAKVDADLTAKNRITGIYQENSLNGLPLVGFLPEPYSSSRSNNTTAYVGQITDTHVFNDRWVNTLGIEVLRFGSVLGNPTINGNYPTKAGLTGLPLGQPSTAFPFIYFGGPDAPQYWAAGTTGFSEISNSQVIQDNVHWLHGRHSVTFGGQVILEQEALAEPSTVNNIVFNNTETAGFDANGNLMPNTGHAYASYLLGLVDSASITDTAVQETGGRWKNYALYLQDDWKISPRLTVNLGLRYTIPKPFTEQHDRTSWLNPDLPNSAASDAPGVLQFAGNGTASCNCDTNVKTHYLTLGPRVGFAYSINAKTVVRSSFSIVHFNGGALGGNGQQQGVGIQGYATTFAPSSSDLGATPTFNWDQGFPAYQHPPFFDPTLGTGSTTENPNSNGGVSYNRPETAGRSPYTEEWNLALEHALPGSMVLSLAYLGTSSHFNGVNGGVGRFSNQIDPKYLALGALLGQQATTATVAQAQASFPEINLPYANFVGSIGQMLRPFPQYSNSGSSFLGPDPWANFGTTSYNGFQATLTRTMKNGLYFLVAYNWSKTFDENGSTVQFASGAPRSAYSLGAERAVSSTDIPQQISISEVYTLPFGRGHRFGNSALGNALIGGWQLSGMEQYSSGSPLGTITGNCLTTIYTSNSCYANFNPAFQGDPRINGRFGSHLDRSTQYINPSAFADAPSYTFGNTARTLTYASLRNEANRNENIAVTKTFPIRDSLRFDFKVDAFNVFNRTEFGGISTAINSAAFGRVSGQSNSPRRLQFEGYLRF